MSVEDGWDPDRAMESLKMERSVMASESEEDLAKRILRENAAHAAQSIVHVALHDANGRTRLAAAQYILERTLGPVNQEQPGQEDWVEKLQEAMRAVAG